MIPTSHSSAIRQRSAAPTQTEQQGVNLRMIPVPEHVLVREFPLVACLVSRLLDSLLKAVVIS